MSELLKNYNDFVTVFKNSKNTAWEKIQNFEKRWNENLNLTDFLSFEIIADILTFCIIADSVNLHCIV